MQIIQLKIKQELIDKARKFSEDVVDETYDRFNQNLEERKLRIFIGKLGELIFSDFLFSRGIEHDTKGMLEVYPGTRNVDSFDFKIPSTGELIDVKTAYKTNHICIIVPYDQFEGGRAKDFYVGIKLDLGRNEAKIHGFTDKEEMAKKKKDFGEGPGYWVYLRDLKQIEELLSMFTQP